MRIKINPDGTFKPLTKGEIREKAIEYFRSFGFNCWRNNNIPVKGRTFIGRKGVPDIIGYGNKVGYTGLFFACEVKTKDDVISKEQKEFLIDLNHQGGYGFIATDSGRGSIHCYLYLNDKS
jgi:hypothetical protein